MTETKEAVINTVKKVICPFIPARIEASIPPFTAYYDDVYERMCGCKTDNMPNKGNGTCTMTERPTKIRYQ